MAHQTLEQRREYVRKYRIANAEKLRAYQIARNEKRRKTKPFQIQLHPDTDKVLKSLPNPFGSFEKAKYVIYRYRSRIIPLYFLTTTCRNTEDCIEIMKHKFKEKDHRNKYCSIYKIQHGIRKLIFREII